MLNQSMRACVYGWSIGILVGATAPAWADDPASAFRQQASPNYVNFQQFEIVSAGQPESAAAANVPPAPSSEPGTGTQPPPGPYGVPAQPPQASQPAPPKAAAPSPFKPNLFANDFSYKKDPAHQYIFGEELKLMPMDVPFLGDSTLSFGGQFRHRYMNEDNRLRPGGPGRSTYDLGRWRNYLDFKSEHLRLYVEMLDASSFNEELPVTPIDENRWNLQNAFVDVPLFERDDKPVIFRYGRQELMYGAQRSVSPLDWGNTRRNFEGFLLSSKGDTWDVDAFATRPVNSATGNIFRPESSDHPDHSRTFSGVYSTFHGVENHTVDLYWLWLREQEPVGLLADGSRHTVGVRWAGKSPVKECGKIVREWDFDLETAYQFGHDNDATGVERDVDALFATGILGHTWTATPWKPRVSGLFYYGSGDDDPADGENNTFSVLFPLGHAWWGIIDNLAGQNLLDYSVQMDVKPTEKLSFTSAIHWFDLASSGDRLYNVAGAALGTPSSDRDVGTELDLVGTYVFNPNFNVQLGYSWFWYGDFVENGPLSRDDATQFYVQTTLSY